jgi:hypothetical protein
VIAVEGARCLAEGGSRSGVLSPAQAYDIKDFLAFLKPYGLSYEVGTVVPASA